MLNEIIGDLSMNWTEISIIFPHIEKAYQTIL